MIDTDTLIEVLEGNIQVSRTIENLPSDPAIISLSQSELAIYACQNGKDNYRNLDEFLSLFVKIYPSRKSCELSYQLSKQYCNPNHNSFTPKVSTFIIAATAITNNFSLYTVFPHYYRRISGIRLFK